jgi:uncharacterized protein (TIGR00251 family)
VSARIALRVQPGARRAGLKGRMADGTIQIAVSAPPEGGKANRAVIEALSELLGVKSRQLKVVRGLGSRGKTVEIEGVEPAEIERRIARACAALERDDGE